MGPGVLSHWRRQGSCTASCACYRHQFELHPQLCPVNLSQPESLAMFAFVCHLYCTRSVPVLHLYRTLYCMQAPVPCACASCCPTRVWTSARRQLQLPSSEQPFVLVTPYPLHISLLCLCPCCPLACSLIWLVSELDMLQFQCTCTRCAHTSGIQHGIGSTMCAHCSLLLLLILLQVGQVQLPRVQAAGQDERADADGRRSARAAAVLPYRGEQPLLIVNMYSGSCMS